VSLAGSLAVARQHGRGGPFLFTACRHSHSHTGTRHAGRTRSEDTWETYRHVVDASAVVWWHVVSSNKDRVPTRPPGPHFAFAGTRAASSGVRDATAPAPRRSSSGGRRIVGRRPRSSGPGAAACDLARRLWVWGDPLCQQGGIDELLLRERFVLLRPLPYELYINRPAPLHHTRFLPLRLRLPAERERHKVLFCFNNYPTNPSLSRRMFHRRLLPLASPISSGTETRSAVDSIACSCRQGR
jgi:hypothetical protein